MDSIKVRSCSNSLYMIFIDFPQKKIGFPASPNMIPDYPRRLSFFISFLYYPGGFEGNWKGRAG
jgi:hypothetical protein